MKRQEKIAYCRLRQTRRGRAIQGVTLPEVLITIVVIGVLTAVAAPNVVNLGNRPLPDTANQVAGVFRLARAKAISQTMPIRVRSFGALINPDGTSSGGINTRLEVHYATSTTVACNSETGWTRDGSFSDENLTFAKNVTLNSTQVDGTTLATPTAWQVCFNVRGMASTTVTYTDNFQGNNVVLTLRQSSDNTTRRIEVFPAGGVQVYDN
ncbi:MAG TPA: GspH/FimT family pseudopilin [Stenomitos sp.]